MNPKEPFPTLMRSSLMRVIMDANKGALALVPPMSVYSPALIPAMCDPTKKVSYVFTCRSVSVNMYLQPHQEFRVRCDCMRRWCFGDGHCSSTDKEGRELQNTLQ